MTIISLCSYNNRVRFVIKFICVLNYEWYWNVHNVVVVIMTGKQVHLPLNALGVFLMNVGVGWQSIITIKYYLNGKKNPLKNKHCIWKVDIDKQQIIKYITYWLVLHVGMKLFKTVWIDFNDISKRIWAKYEFVVFFRIQFANIT